ncbi:hypothetical protein ACIBKY_17790 [Nonomuraea sp. NPDC050394]|uniref:hypothetical protein n=1 Tax=Nonomuraea sp. NPDC050394 TaxID=3364363 RepID=UPI0037AB1D73
MPPGSFPTPRPLPHSLAASSPPCRFVATWQLIAGKPGRREHVVLPVVLIGIGLPILVEGGAF